ncbi:hypothetical protein CASFOL_022969 [Castilleja foliolosa]|uniref:Morc S5 domain-containing protein n=1 Tax=Castilleja foliolosa TaxID=1961234 RepID=A0ABD3CU88_9LAMI
MPPEREKQIPAIATVIDLDSDGEDSGPVVSASVSRVNSTGESKPSIRANLQTKPHMATQSPSVISGGDAFAANNRPLDNRSFWRAGAYEIGPAVSTLIQGDLEHARVHPKFLHSNATSHKWAFGAIAELLDNSVDEIVNGATFVTIDRVYNKKDNSPALLFQDDGGGMDPESMRKCMSLGYSSKTSNKTIGQCSKFSMPASLIYVNYTCLPHGLYKAPLNKVHFDSQSIRSIKILLNGNGFKTSTMRLGADVIVFSRASRSGRATQSIGLLSYTFLRRTRQDDVIVPMIDFDISDNWAEPIIYSSKNDWASNLKTILEWSPFASKEDLMLQFENIGSHGTKVIIYNLWMNDEGIYELNFDDDDKDLKLRDEVNQGNVSKSKRVLELQSHLSYRIRFSLRIIIILRGKPVEQFIIADDLKHSKTVTYSPQVGQGLKEVTVETSIGFIKEAPALPVCGFNVYHKNRLIRPYWKVTADGNSRGHGVVGVLEANFIEPAHDKQDFERSSLFNKLESRLKQMVHEYWKGHCHFVGHLPDGMKKNNVQNNLTTQPQVEVSGNICGTIVNNKSANVQPVSVPDAAPHLETSPDNRSLDQICEENIQLFMRCKEYKTKQVEKIRTIEDLEKELEETRKKCARLSSDLETQRKQMIVTQR